MKEDTPTFQHPQSQSVEPMTATPNDEINTSIQNLSSQIQTLQGKRAFLKTDVWGLFQTVSAVPTQIPTTPYEQIQIYVNSTTFRLYWYDAVGHAWHYIVATA